MRQPMVLLVMRRPERLHLLWDLEDCGAWVFVASSVREAGQLLQTISALDLVLTELSLPDGSWEAIRDMMQRFSSQARLVLCAPSAKTSSLGLPKGVFDVLALPCDGGGLCQLLDLAGGRSRAA